MRTPFGATLLALSLVAAPALAQSPSGTAQSEADKGIKTQNSGASGYVGAQDKPGSASRAPGDSNHAGSNTATSAPSAGNSGTGIAGAPGGKNGPPPQGTVGSSQNTTVQQQDTSNVQGLPGNKSGPPAKR
jgi:hypothetical protein